MGTMRQEEIWDVEAAQSYGTVGTGMFAPEVLNLRSIGLPSSPGMDERWSSRSEPSRGRPIVRARSSLSLASNSPP